VSAFALLPSCIRYALPQNLWQIKTGRVQKNDAPTEATQHGNKMEPIARLLYQNLMRCDVLPSPFKKHPYLLIGAEPDGFVSHANFSFLHFSQGWFLGSRLRQTLTKSPVSWKSSFLFMPALGNTYLQNTSRKHKFKWKYGI